ncbi:MAG: HD domain-containing protein [Armatimonadota bacterium]|nr:HD domain-containing protein [Armatimonadota bacterium]MDR7427076.1 HD domain-containing protein [Armatimonadota bacterium]MDR7464084.1 HD domain-containing protein [Armatimonadota bacterium]MDR7471033.1 HD domain-containing protein [Armatimonadota bacterium]MDR7473644.1 HD domain-containing protein [Armatimonadota bacterium]
MLDESLLKEARILIVDDEKASVRLLERLLRACGWTNLRSTYDPRTVCTLIRTFRPDLVLLDLHMPHAGGLEVLAQTRALLAAEGVPILIVTADDGPGVRETVLEAGASDFMAKPVDAAALPLRVRALLEARLRRLQERGPGPFLEESAASRAEGVVALDVEALERLALVAEYRDDLSRGEHVKRVGQASALLARALGLGEAEVEMVRLAAPLHDLGKIAIPESILLKPGRLTPEELTVMQSHTSLGAAMLAGSRHPVLQMAQRIALSHHERWDGGGFPQGLRGEAIPLEARIVAVADAFDAMSADRPYRLALSSEEVWEILVDGAGKQWDLQVVDALASLVGPQVQVDRPFDLSAFLQREQAMLDPRR